MSLIHKASGSLIDLPQGSVYARAGTAKQVEQIWLNSAGIWYPVWGQEPSSTRYARWGVAQFSDTDFTGGKDDPNQAGDPYDRWTGVQDFIDSELTNIHAAQESGIQVSLDIPFPYYAYFACPIEMGPANFIDNDTGFPGGWDGAKWPDGGTHSATGPIVVQYDDGDGLSYWYVYRTDFSGIGQMSWTVNFPNLQ